MTVETGEVKSWGPTDVMNTQSGGVKLDTGVESTVELVLARGMR
jgi:hypothetical protein